MDGNEIIIKNNVTVHEGVFYSNFSFKNSMVKLIMCTPNDLTYYNFLFIEIFSWFSNGPPKINKLKSKKVAPVS